MGLYSRQIGRGTTVAVAVGVGSDVLVGTGVLVAVGSGVFVAVTVGSDVFVGVGLDVQVGSGVLVAVAVGAGKTWITSLMQDPDGSHATNVTSPGWVATNSAAKPNCPARVPVTTIVADSWSGATVTL